MLRLNLFRDGTGEPRLFSHGRKHEDGNRQWWLHWPGNCLGLEWAWGRRRLGAMIALDDEGETHLMVSVSLPYILTFYLLLEKCNWIIRLAGLKWQREVSNVGDCRREIGFNVMDNALWIYPWVNSDTSMDYWVIRPLDFLFGRQRHSREGLREESALVTLPEGAYPARVKLYTAVWKRPRWPWAKRVSRAEVEVEGGVPIAGKGENGWDMEDDAIEEMTMPAATAAEAVARFAEIVWHSRKARAGIDWQPSDGWPAHLIQ